MLTSDLTDFYRVPVFWWVVMNCYLHTSFFCLFSWTSLFYMPVLCVSSTKLSNHNLLVSHTVTLPSFWLVLGTILWIFLRVLHNLELGWLLLHVLVKMRVCCQFLHDIMMLPFSVLFLLVPKSCAFWLSLGSEVTLFQKLYRTTRFFPYTLQ